MLRERLRATEDAARRLAEEAAAERRTGVPSSGWDVPHRAEQAHSELDELVRLLTALREVLPPELRAQLADLARQLVLFVRAVLDWWIARLGDDGDPPAPGRYDPLEDIPVT